jgi:transaldolase
MPDPTQQLLEAGQSIWLDYIRRGLLTSGGLSRMIAAGWIRGVTSNPTIFHKAITESDDYKDAFRVLAGREPLSSYEAYLKIAGDDIRLAADALRPVYDATEGADGFVSFEAQAAGTDEMLAEARRMFALVGRPNVMIKVPGVPDGVATVQRLIAEGINVNITLLFDVAMYERFAEAYLSGLEQRLAGGQPIDRIGSVASFFVSRVDTKVDALLPDGSPLRGKIAVANARRAYGRFEKIFSGSRWQKLAATGARVQRPLWASTGTKNPAYSDILYVEELVAPHTVNTMPEATLTAFIDHGKVRPAIAKGMAESEAALAALPSAGVDLAKVTAELLEEGLASFAKDFDRLLAEIDQRIREARTTAEVTT